MIPFEEGAPIMKFGSVPAADCRAVVCAISFTPAGSGFSRTARKASQTQSNVLIVTEGNLALDAFFDQEPTQQLAQVKRLKPADLGKPEYRQMAVEKAGYDLVNLRPLLPEGREGHAESEHAVHRHAAATVAAGQTDEHPKLIIQQGQSPSVAPDHHRARCGHQRGVRVPPAEQPAEGLREKAKKKPLPQLDIVLETTATDHSCSPAAPGRNKDLVIWRNRG